MRAGEGSKEDWVPRRAEGVRIAELPLSPEDAFVLSQLDGRTRPSEVSELTGLDKEAVQRTLERLEQLGAVAYGGVSPPSVRPGARAAARVDPRREPSDPPPAADKTNGTGPAREPRRERPVARGARSTGPITQDVVVARDPRRDDTVPPTDLRRERPERGKAGRVDLREEPGRRTSARVDPRSEEPTHETSDHVDPRVEPTRTSSDPRQEPQTELATTRSAHGRTAEATRRSSDPRRDGTNTAGSHFEERVFTAKKANRPSSDIHERPGPSRPKNKAASTKLARPLSADVKLRAAAPAIDLIESMNTGGAAAAKSTESADIDLDAEQRLRINAIFEQLESATHYELLSVASDAPKKVIKKAYFELIAFFHPDKYFRRELGDYRSKLEKIFQTLTEASEILTRKATRAEYDAYLEARQATRALDAVMTSIPPPPPPNEPPPIIINEPPAAPAPGANVSPQPDVSASPKPGVSADARSQALARRLAGGKVTTRWNEVVKDGKATTRGNAVSESGKETPAVDQKAVAESLKRFAEARRNPQIAKFVKAGKDALEEEAWVSAVNALRIALTLAPNDEELRELYDRADEKAAVQLAESYESRARYEEKNGDWESAADSWERVSRARKGDAEPLRRIAECFSNTGEPKRGIGPGREAVRLAPRVVTHRITLAKLYELCGMNASAIGEVTRALEQKPQDAELKAQLKRLKENP